jgi:hypothetical protein
MPNLVSLGHIFWRNIQRELRGHLSAGYQFCQECLQNRTQTTQRGAFEVGELRERLGCAAAKSRGSLWLGHCHLC